MLKFMEEARTLHQANKTSKAAQAARHAYAIATEHLPTGHPERTLVTELLGRILIDLKQVSEGEKLLRMAGALKASPQTEAEAARRNQESARLLQLPITGESIHFIEETVTFAQDHLPHDSPLLLEALYHVGILLWNLKRLPEAERTLTIVLQQRRLRGIDARFLETALYLVNVLLDLDQPGDVRLLCYDVLKVCQTLDEVDQLSLASIHTALARVLDAKSDEAELFVHLRRAAELSQEVNGIHDVEVGRLWRQLGFFYLNSKRRDEGEKCFASAFEAYQVALGPEHPETLEVLLMRGMNLVRMAAERGREGLEMMQRANQIAIATAPPGHPMRVNFARMLELGETTFANYT